MGYFNHFVIFYDNKIYFPSIQYESTHFFFPVGKASIESPSPSIIEYRFSFGLRLLTWMSIKPEMKKGKLSTHKRDIFQQSRTCQCCKDG